VSELNNIFQPSDKALLFPCPTQFIQTDPEMNTISFVVQEGPVRENGVNGCQIDDIIWAAATIIRNFNSRFPCRENSCAITHLDEAMMWLEKRTKDRTERKVEGTDQK
jgi:hypothetical protein